MTHKVFTTVILFIWVLLPVSVTSAKGRVYMKNTGIKWRSYGHDAFAEARRKKKPLYIFIYADWCKWCEKFEVETLENAAIRKRMNNDFVPVAVNFDKQKKLAYRLRAGVVPTSILLTPEGKKLLRFYGFIGPADLGETFDEVLALWRKGELPDQDFGDENTCCPLHDDPGKGSGP